MKKVQLVKCGDKQLWYNYDKSKFPIKTNVIETSERIKNNPGLYASHEQYYRTFFDKREEKDFYYCDELMGYIAKSDCVNDEEYNINDLGFNPNKPSTWPIKSKETDIYGYNTSIHTNQLDLFKEQEVFETKKFDQGKPDFTLIPQLALLEVAKIFTHGKEKYGQYNYSLGTDHTRYVSAGLRHANQYLTGEDVDESGVHHLACMAANALMALDNIMTKKGSDNRNKVYGN